MSNSTIDDVAAPLLHSQRTSVSLMSGNRGINSASASSRGIGMSNENSSSNSHLRLGFDDPHEIAIFEAAVKLTAPLTETLQSFATGLSSLSTSSLPLETLRKRNTNGNRGFLALKNEGFASLTYAPVKCQDDKFKLDVVIEHPSLDQLFSHPLALVSYLPKDFALFIAGAVAGVTAKTITAPLDRIKLSMQVHGLRATTQETARKGLSFLEASMKIGKEEGLRGYWRGNFPQVIRVVPYSAVQLFAYEAYKKFFRGKDKELSVAGRLAAGACAGMTSTLVTYPLDVLRLRVALDPVSKTMFQVASTMLKEEGLCAFYKGLGPSLLGIAPYMALNFCAFDLIKKSLPEEMQKTPVASFTTALLSASLATSMCYPLDTVRRQLQMKGTPFLTIADAVPGIIARDGVLGLYRGFLPNALKTLPTSSIRLTIFDAAKRLINASQQEFQRLLKLRREQLVKSQL